VESLDWTGEPHPRFPVQDHILSIGGDALNHSFNVASALGIQTLTKTFYTDTYYVPSRSYKPTLPPKKQKKTSVPNKFCFHYLLPKFDFKPKKSVPP
jgi:hypothetical protein